MHHGFEACKRQLNERLEALCWRVVEGIAAFQQPLDDRIAVLQQLLNERLEEFAQALYAELARFGAVCDLLVMRLSALDRSYADLGPRVDRIEAIVLRSRDADERLPCR